MLKKYITISQAVAGFTLNLKGSRLSPNTINDYTNTFKKFIPFVDNCLISEIQPEDISEFLSSFPDLTNKTLSNYHVGLSSLWQWLESQDLVEKNIIRLVERPKPEKRDIIPLEKEEIKAIFKSLPKSKSYARPGQKSCQNTLPNIDRNRAMLLFLLDNGLRCSELSNLKYGDLNTRMQTACILGKGNKQRHVPYSARTAQAVWKYLTVTRGDLGPEDYLFVTRDGKKMERTVILQTVKDIGYRANVPDINVHRFRHTFAIMYLRAGGDAFTLKEILGHSTMDMVNRYVRIAEVDIIAAHRRASPVEFLNL